MAYNKTFDMDCKGGTKVRVFAENFASAAELVSHCKGRKCVSGMEHDDFFNRDLKGGSWYDFNDSKDLVHLIETGIDNPKLISEVGKYAKTAQVKDEERLTKKYLDVAGSAVDVPLYLSGEPACMYNFKRQRVRTKIVKICIYCKALCYVDPEEYKRAGELIAKTVVKLEKAGYRIRLLAMDAYEDRNWKKRGMKYDGRHSIWVVTHMIKKENEPMNYRRVLFPLTRMAYHRGLGFGWMAVNGSPYIDALGGSIESVVWDDEEREKMFAKACGEGDYIILSQDDVIGYIDKFGLEKAQNIIDTKVMNFNS